MVPGQPVPGLLMLNWRFVASDVANIAERLHTEFLDSRLVVNEVDHQLAVATFFRREHHGEPNVEDRVRTSVQADGGLWVLAFKCRNPDGSPMVGEPDARILEEARARDNRRRLNPMTARDWVRFCENRAATEEAAQEALIADAMGDVAERAFHEHVMLNHGHYTHIYVPRGAER